MPLNFKIISTALNLANLALCCKCYHSFKQLAMTKSCHFANKYIK